MSEFVFGGVKTKESGSEVTENGSEVHLNLGIEAMAEIGLKGEQIKHFKY